jgi:hypothetical protein
MKYLIKFLGCLWLIMIITSCDKIEAPFERQSDHGNDTTSAVRKVLLEDYTGHKCINCPTAAVTAQDLKDDYGDRLVLLSIHAGIWALPDASGDYTTDFRTPAGDEFDTYFGVSDIGNPNGMVNRTVYNQSLILGPGMWGAAIQQIINNPPDATIELALTFDLPSRKLGGDCHVQFLNPLTGRFMLCLYLIENDIVAAQKNNNTTIGPTPDWINYVHEHVLRGAINGTWGEEITTGTAQTTIQYHITFSYFEIKAEWKPENCKVVAFIYNSDSKEVIQAEEEDIE